MGDESQPITGICVVANKEQRPVHFEVDLKDIQKRKIDTTTDGQDADIWKDGFFRRVTRYLCFTRQPSNTVLADLTAIRETDQIPQGYTSLPTTSDTKEPILKKKVLVAHFAMRGTVASAICGIRLTSSKAKTRPFDASLRGEINGLSLYLKMGTLSIPQGQPNEVKSYGSQPPASNAQPYAYNATSQHGLPHQASNSTAPTQPLPYHYPSRGNTLNRQASMVQTNAATERIHSAIEGVPFEVHPLLQQTNQSQDIPTLHLPTDQDVFFRYSYDFRTEKQCKQKRVSPL